MNVRKFTMTAGIVFLVVGALGFLPGINLAPHAGDPHITGPFYGRLFGLFPVNSLHNLVHIAFGIWGILAARSWGSALTYCRITGVAYVALAVIGLIPNLNTFFGTIPLFGHDVWLHAVLGGVLCYFGFVLHHKRTTV